MKELIYYVGGFLLYMLGGAGILLGSIAIYNRIATGADSGREIKMPEYHRAVQMVASTIIIPILFISVAGIGDYITLLNSVNLRNSIVIFHSCCVQLIAFPVFAFVLTKMLPTTFPRALLIAFLYAIFLTIGAVVLYNVLRFLP